MNPNYPPKRAGFRAFDFILLTVFLYFFVCFVVRQVDIRYGQKGNISNPVKGDKFDASLMRLNTLQKAIAYCDSLYSADPSGVSYPDIVSETLRSKFFHGYSYYSASSNLVGATFAPVVGNNAMAIVIPDDIMDRPSASCSQQSIVGMEIFKKKGYPVRKVSMFDNEKKIGHFAYEVFYGGKWHYFDTNCEPDIAQMIKRDRPSSAYLAANPHITALFYYARDTVLFQHLLQSGVTGEVNKFPAPHAYLFQRVTKIFTSFGWIFALAVLLCRRVLVVARIRRNVVMVREMPKEQEMQKAQKVAFSQGRN